MGETETIDDTAFEETTETDTKLSILEAIKAPNLVPALKEQDVNRIGSEALAEYRIDLASCEDFHEKYDRAMQMAMQETKAKTFPWAGASNIVYPLVTEGSIQFQARAYPAIIDGQNVVKGRVLGNDPEGTKRERADRVAAYMNWQFLNDIPGWEEDTDKLLLQLPIVGCVFRKTWQDPIRNQCNSETVTAKDFVVHYNTASLDKAPRFTHVLRYYPHEIEAFIRTGAWAKVPYQGEDGSDPHSIVEFYEQSRLIDMDEDGLPEPYVVTFNEDGAVCRIVACFDMDGIFVTSPALGKQVPLAELMAGAKEQPDQASQMMSDMKVVRIERKDYFTKYGFIPNPDGSFYDMGFGTLTDNLSAAVNTIINQLIDAGTLANMQGGFLGGGTKIKSGNMRFTPGEWKRVDGVSAGPLRDNILPLQLPGPSPVLFQLLGMLIDGIKGITSVSDILTGNQDSQTAPTTALALIEQGQKVFTAIYQRIHRAFGNECKIVFGLNRDYLDEEKYFALDDNPQVVGKADFEDRDLDVRPVSDPRAINDRVKMAKAELLSQHNGDPLINQLEIRKRQFEAAGIGDMKALFEVPQQPPPPEAVKAMADTENSTAQRKADVRSKDALTAKTLLEAAQLAYTLGIQVKDPIIEQQAGQLLVEALALADSVSGQMKDQGDGGEPTDGAGGVPEMAGQPGDAGVPAIPPGLPGPTGDAMGAGGTAGPEGAIAG